MGRREALAILGLSDSHTIQDLKQAWRQTSKSTHPDTDGGSAEKFRKAEEAYRLLSETRPNRDGWGNARRVTVDDLFGRQQRQQPVDEFQQILGKCLHSPNPDVRLAANQYVQGRHQAASVLFLRICASLYADETSRPDGNGDYPM